MAAIAGRGGAAVATRVIGRGGAAVASRVRPGIRTPQGARVRSKARPPTPSSVRKFRTTAGDRNLKNVAKEAAERAGAAAAENANKPRASGHPSAESKHFEAGTTPAEEAGHGPGMIAEEKKAGTWIGGAEDLKITEGKRAPEPGVRVTNIEGTSLELVETKRDGIVMRGNPVLSEFERAHGSSSGIPFEGPPAEVMSAHPAPSGMSLAEIFDRPNFNLATDGAGLSAADMDMLRTFNANRGAFPEGRGFRVPTETKNPPRTPAGPPRGGRGSRFSPRTRETLRYNARNNFERAGRVTPEEEGLLNRVLEEKKSRPYLAARPAEPTELSSRANRLAADRAVLLPAAEEEKFVNWVFERGVRGGNWVNYDSRVDVIRHNISRLVQVLGGPRGILKTAAKLAGAGASIAAIVTAVRNWLTAEVTKVVDAPATKGPPSKSVDSAITKHIPGETTTNPPFQPSASQAGMPANAAVGLSVAHAAAMRALQIRGEALAFNKRKTEEIRKENEAKNPAHGYIRSGASSFDLGVYGTESKELPPETPAAGTTISGDKIGFAKAYETVNAPRDVWDFIFEGIDLPMRTKTGKHISSGILGAAALSSGDPTAVKDIYEYTHADEGDMPEEIPDEEMADLPEEGNTEVDMDLEIDDPQDAEFDPDWDDLKARLEAEMAAQHGGTRKTTPTALGLNSSVKYVYSPFAPLGAGDSGNVKSAPIYPPNDVTDMELEYRKGVMGNAPLEGDLLSEKQNDPRGRKLQTSIETLKGVESADIFHPNIYYEPAVNPKVAYMKHAQHRCKSIDDATEKYSWEWQDIQLRKNNRDSEVFVPFTYDTSMNTSLPAQADPYTVSDDCPRPYTPTEPRMGPQLYDAPQLVGVGFDERNPPPDPFTTTHSTSTVTSTTGAGLQVVPEGLGGIRVTRDNPNPKKRNIDDLDGKSNPVPIISENANKAINAAQQPVLGRIQRRRRDNYNSANQTNPWAWQANPTAPTEAVPANIGRSL